MARMKRLSEDLCWAIVRMGGMMPIADIIMNTGAGKRTIQRILTLHRRTGSPYKKIDPRALGRPRLLLDNDVGFLKGTVAQTPDVFMDEMRDRLEDINGVRVSLSTVWRTLHRAGYRMKKLTRDAIERSEEKRAAFLARIGIRYTAEQLVFVDESSCDRRTTYRGRAWAFQGAQARRKCFFIRGRRYSVLPAISLDGILGVKIIEGSFNKALFRDFVEGILSLMSPFPAPNSVLVMDNCKIHKATCVHDLVEEWGNKLEFLSPYSPDFNPIELAFSSIKANIRREGDILREEMEKDGEEDVLNVGVIMELHQAVFSAVTPEKARAWFHHCNYI